MIQKNNLCVLPFYDSIEEQHHRKPYAFGAVYPLIVPSELIPFQFARIAQPHIQDITVDFSTSTLYPSFKPGTSIDGTTINCGAISMLTTKGISQNTVIDNISRELSLYAGSTLQISVPNGCQITSIKFNGTSVANITSASGNISNGVFTPSTQANEHTIGVSSGNVRISSIVVYFIGVAQITSCDIMSLDGTIAKSNIESRLYNAGLQTYTDVSYDYFVLSNGITNLNLQPGQYYLVMHSDSANESYVSEVFTVVDSVTNYVQVTWKDYADLELDGQPKYMYENGNFLNVLYVDTFIGKPKYSFDEEGKERDGYFFVEKQVSKKTYNFAFVAPEFLCDALRLSRLSDYVAVTDKNTAQVYVCDSILVEPAWEEQGDLASVEVEFNSGTVIKKIATGWVEA